MTPSLSAAIRPDLPNAAPGERALAQRLDDTAAKVADGGASIIMALSVGEARACARALRASADAANERARRPATRPPAPSKPRLRVKAGHG